MTENEAKRFLKIEKECANRDCDRNCAQCDIVQKVEDLNSAYDAAIKALEEVQRWHTSVINPKIKNVFANTSTQICQNCDHKDEYIEELEAEVEPYRALEKRLTDMFGGELSLEDVTDELERQLKEPDNPHPINAKILTYEDAAAWDAYHAIGTPEECRAAMEKQTAKKGIREKIKKGYNRGMHHYYCPVCYEKGDLRNKYNVGLYCSDCGQKLDWEDEE